MKRGWFFLCTSIFLLAIGVSIVTLLGGCSKAAQQHGMDLFDRGRAAQQHKDYARAIADYTAALPSMGSDPRVLYDRGVAYYDLKQYDKAAADLRAALGAVQSGDKRLLPTFIEAAYFYRGISRVQIAQWSQARDDLRLAVRFYPRSWLAWDSLAYARAALGDYRDAIVNYGRGLRLYPKDPIDRVNRGWALYSLGRYQSALADYNVAVALARRWATAYQDRGLAYAGLHNFTVADRDYSRAIALNPTAWAWAYRCEERESAGRVQAALSDCNRALALYPNWSEIYVDRAWAKAVLGNNKAALQDANLAIRYDRRNATAFKYRGWIRTRLMEYRAAFVDYNQALSIAPHYEAAAAARTQLANWIVGAQHAGVTAFGIGSLNVAKAQDATQPTQSEYQQRASECGGYFSESDSYFDDCVDNGVAQAKDDRSADQEAADQAASDQYNAEQQIQEQINYQQQEAEDAQAAAQENENYQNTENSGSGYEEQSQPEESTQESQPEYAPQESEPEPAAPQPEGGGDGGGG